jgi:cobalt/nickel transport protein
MTDKKNYIFVLAGITAALIIAMFISVFASSFPDGLEKVAENLGFIDKVEETAPEGIFLIPDYAMGGVESELWQTSLAGLSGVLIIAAVFGIVYLIYRAVGKRQ